MKFNQATGPVLFLSGTILFGIIHLAMALYLPSLSGVMGEPAGIDDLLSYTKGWIPYILSIVMMIAGLCLLFIPRFNSRL